MRWRMMSMVGPRPQSRLLLCCLDGLVLDMSGRRVALSCQSIPYTVWCRGAHGPGGQGRKKMEFPRIVSTSAPR